MDAFPAESVPAKTMTRVQRVMSADYRRRLQTEQRQEPIVLPREPVDWRDVARVLFWVAVFAFSAWFGIYLAFHGYAVPTA